MIMDLEIMNLPFCGTSARAVDNLSNNLRLVFQRFGAVSHVEVLHDHPHGAGRPVALIQMPDDAEAWRAIEALRGTDFNGRDMCVIRVP